MKQKLRRIILDGRPFLYRLSQRYEERAKGSWTAHYEFRVYLEGFKKSPLVLHFASWEDARTGGPLHTGSPLILGDPSSPRLNLNQPGHAEVLIRKALSEGWSPSETQRPLKLESAENWLEGVAIVYSEKQILTPPISPVERGRNVGRPLTDHQAAPSPPISRKT